jgi:hypothetical protein
MSLIQQNPHRHTHLQRFNASQPLFLVLLLDDNERLAILVEQQLTNGATALHSIGSSKVCARGKTNVCLKYSFNRCSSKMHGVYCAQTILRSHRV